jgi:hypothetical protein
MLNRLPTHSAAKFLLLVWAGAFTALGHAEPAGKESGCAWLIDVHGEAEDCDCSSHREGRCLGCSDCCEFAPAQTWHLGVWRAAYGGCTTCVGPLSLAGSATPEVSAGTVHRDAGLWWLSSSPKLHPTHSPPLFSRPPPLL